MSSSLLLLVHGCTNKPLWLQLNSFILPALWFLKHTTQTWGQAVNLLNLLCFYTVGGNWRTRRKPTQTTGATWKLHTQRLLVRPGCEAVTFSSSNHWTTVWTPLFIMPPKAFVQFLFLVILALNVFIFYTTMLLTVINHCCNIHIPLLGISGLFILSFLIDCDKSGRCCWSSSHERPPVHLIPLNAPAKYIPK